MWAAKNGSPLAAIGGEPRAKLGKHPQPTRSLLVGTTKRSRDWSAAACSERTSSDCNALPTDLGRRPPREAMLSWPCHRRSTLRGTL